MCALSSDCVLRAGLLTQAADAIEYMQKIIPVQPHGRLIDQDAILREVDDYPNQWMLKNALLQLFHNAPTVIPASKEET